MKTLYRVLVGFSRKDTAAEEITEFFNDFDPEMLDTLYCPDESNEFLDEFFCKDYDSIFDDANLRSGMTRLTIAEYELSEDDLYSVLMDGRIDITPKSIKYHFWDENLNDFKEFHLKGFT